MSLKFSKAIVLSAIALIVAGVGVTKLVKAYSASEAVSAPRVVIEHVETYNEAPALVGQKLDDQNLGGTAYDLQNFQAVNIYGAASLYGATTFSGSLSLTGPLTSTASVTVGKFTAGGTAEAQTGVVTSTLSASSLCNDSFLSVTPVTTTPTLTLPSTTTLFASCLGTVGQYRDIVVQSKTTSTIWAAGAGGTIINASALTIAANKGAVLRIIRDTSLTYIVAFINLVN